jgi:hypothetical protein
MNKKVNTLLFILCATLFNIITAIISFIILLILYLNFIIPLLPESGYSWGFILIFLSSITISFFVYRAVLKVLLNKVEVEKYFDPLYVKRNIKKN